MSKGSWKRTGNRVSAQDPADGDIYHAVDKSPSQLLNSFGVIKAYPNDKYRKGWDRIFGKKRENSDECSDSNGE